MYMYIRLWNEIGGMVGTLLCGILSDYLNEENM
jgi:sugar phosphate permease